MTDTGSCNLAAAGCSKLKILLGTEQLKFNLSVKGEETCSQ